MALSKGDEENVIRVSRKMFSIKVSTQTYVARGPTTQMLNHTNE